MSTNNRSRSRCPTCGNPLPAGAAACPSCQPENQLRPLGGIGPPVPPPPPRQQPPPPRPQQPPPPRRPPLDEPLPPDPGGEVLGTWASIRSIVRLDPVFGGLLALLALNLVRALLVRSFLDIVLCAAILWGVLTFQRWGYWVAMVLSGLALFAGGGLALLAGALGILARPVLLLGLALALGPHLFTIIVLYTRRDRFA